jgi:ferrochelatase
MGLAQPTEILLCNFGGPTSANEVQPFLFELFNDPLIIRAPLGSTFRRVLANRISKKRAPKSAHEYARIGYSPINRYTEIQARQLEKLLREQNSATNVHVVNRYTRPFANEVVPKLREGARIFILPLYPHFCHSTTATSVREVDIALRSRFADDAAEVIRINSWWHNKSYLAHHTQSIWKTLVEKTEPNQPLTILFSAHGIPKRYRERGDPYVVETYGHFFAVKRALATKVAERNADVHWQVAFQSRVGPVEWTKPYTDETIAALGKSRGGQLLIVPVSFTSDHIETLYEMDVTYRELAIHSGFKSVARVSGENESSAFTSCLVDILGEFGFF